MANPQARPGNPLLRTIGIVILSLIVILGLVVLIVWLALRPKKLIYTIENASVQDFNLSGNHLDASYDFLLRAYNPNSRVSVHYDSVDINLVFSDQNLALGSIQPFVQPHKNVTRLDVRLASKSVVLPSPVSADLAQEQSTEEIDLDLWIKARIRFQIGVWKFRHRNLRISCSPVVFLSKSKNFKRVICSTQL